MEYELLLEEYLQRLNDIAPVKEDLGGLYCLLRMYLYQHFLNKFN